MPSPELVAASGAREGLRPAVALGVVAFVIVGTIAAVLLNGQVDLYRQIPFEKPPAVLVDQARQFLRKVGYTGPPADSAWGFALNQPYIQYVREHDTSPDRWSRAGVGAIGFWYRQSPGTLVPWSFSSQTVSQTDPPMEVPGEIAMALTTQGHLRSFTAVPLQTEQTGAESPAPDWSVFFSEAGLDISGWAPAEPERDPLFHADTLVAWTGVLENRPEIPMRIEAAARRGKVISFRLTGPWTPELRAPSPLRPGLQAAIGLALTVILAVIGGAAFFARRNLRMGRGDRKGAMRLALASACLIGLSWIFGAHHVASTDEIGFFISSFAFMLLTSGVFWLVYVALEPFVRRKSPDVLVSWTRALSGEWRDPRVSRDVLFGVAFGVTIYCFRALSLLVVSQGSGVQ
jgi:hypothetical protein